MAIVLLPAVAYLVISALSESAEGPNSLAFHKDTSQAPKQERIRIPKIRRPKARIDPSKKDFRWSHEQDNIQDSETTAFEVPRGKFYINPKTREKPIDFRKLRSRPTKKEKHFTT